jgi:hypothetical protein
MKVLYIIHDLHIPLGQYTTITQTEIYAVGVQENLGRGYLGNSVHIVSDSWAALRAFTCHQTRS